MEGELVNIAHTPVVGKLSRLEVETFHYGFFQRFYEERQRLRAREISRGKNITETAECLNKGTQRSTYTPNTRPS